MKQILIFIRLFVLIFFLGACMAAGWSEIVHSSIQYATWSGIAYLVITNIINESKEE